MDNNESKKVRGPHWVHDELLLTLELYILECMGNTKPVLGKTNAKVIEMSKLLNRLPIHNERFTNKEFRNPNGVSLRLSNWRHIDPTNEDTGSRNVNNLMWDIWDEYHDKVDELQNITKNIKIIAFNQKLNNEVSLFNEGEEEGDSFKSKEGKILYSWVKSRERSPKLRNKKIATHLKNNDSLSCEVCGFDFEFQYGEIGKKYIECHHIVPLSLINVEKETKLEDLILICSNCHRIIHRNKKQPIDPTELRKLIKRRLDYREF